MSMGAQAWDERYARADLVWSAGPNATVAQWCADLPPGRAVDLGAGEGRNGIWLAQRGWDVTAVDFSSVGLERARSLAAQAMAASASMAGSASAAVGEGDGAGSFRTEVADLTGWEAGGTAYDLVLVVFIHLERPQRRRLHRAAAAALAPGGTVLILAHDRSNLAGGVGGPQDPAVLPTPAEICDDLAGMPVDVVTASVVARPVTVEGASRVALDCLVVARRRQEQQRGL